MRSQNNEVMTEAKENEAIGSDFESLKVESLLKRIVTPPWVRKGINVTYMQTGRVALQGIAHILRKRGYTSVLLPAFLCDSMVEPFIRESFHIIPVSMTSELSVDPVSLLANTKALPNPPVVLVAEYFGRTPSRKLVDACRVIQQLGGIVIDDETHRVFRPYGSIADVSIASLRKLLPVADGAYIRANDPSLLPIVEQHSSIGEQRWESMDQKARFGSTQYIRSSFEMANNALESALGMYSPTDRSIDTVQHLDYHRLVDIRMANSEALTKFINTSFAIVNPPGERTLPSHLVIRTANPKNLQNFLAANSIYCPIHWRKSIVMHTEEPWPQDLLSLPIDHRYTIHDMKRIADVLNAWHEGIE